MYPLCTEILISISDGTGPYINLFKIIVIIIHEKNKIAANPTKKKKENQVNVEIRRFKKSSSSKKARIENRQTQSLKNAPR